MAAIRRGAAAGGCLLVAVVLAGCGSVPPRASAKGPDPAACPTGTTTVTSQAQGTASGSPDLLTLAMGVTTSAPTAESALAQNSADANALIAALHTNGVGDPDIQTSQLSVQQTYSAPPNPVPTGYQVNNELTVKLHDLTKAGNLIDDAAKAAGNAIRIQSIGYSLSDDSDLQQQARRDAVTKATAQARAMATGAGMRLGALCSETDIQPQAPLGYGGMGGAIPSAGAPSGPAGPPVQAGTEQVTAQVTTVYEVMR